MLTGLCVVCKKPSRDLNTCWSCGALVCPEHTLPTGCAACMGRKMIGVRK